MMNDWSSLVSPIVLSLKVALIASILVFLAGIAAARVMARSSFPGKTLVETAILLPLVLPPTVIGFVLLMLLGRRSWIGRFYEWLTQEPILFTWGAAVIASVVVALPLVYQTMKVGFASIDTSLEDAARSDGANERNVLLRITLPLAARSLITAYILGFARGLGEFGATIMLAGNIPGRTQTIPTAIYVAVDSGHTDVAWALTAVVIVISYVLLLLTGRQQKRIGPS